MIPKRVLMQLKGKRLKRFPRGTPPKGIEREYFRAMRPYLETLKRVIRHHIINQLHTFASDVSWRRPGADSAQFITDAADDILKSFKAARIELQRDYTEDELKRLAFKYGMSVSEFNRMVLERGFKTVLGIDVLFQEPYLSEQLEMFSTNNAHLITKIGDDTLDRVQEEVFSSFRQGLRWEEIALEVAEIGDEFPMKRARLVARDQVNKLNGQLNGLRQQEVGVERYTWRGMLDERERDSHREQEGEVYDWDDPPAETGHPGDDIQCRCYAEPVLDDLLGSDDDEADDQDE